MTHEQLAHAIYTVAHTKGTFTLRSGVESNEYFDKYLFESDPIILRQIAEHTAKLVPKNAELLGGLEMGGIPIAVMLSQITLIPTVFVRKKPKDYGTCKYAEGGAVAGKTILIVEDVVTSGGAVLDAVEKLRADGAIIHDVLCVIDRESGGREALQEQRLTLHALFCKSELQ